MANPEHVELVKRGADAIREWRERSPDTRLDLRSADLRGVNLCKLPLSEADLSESILRRARLDGADLREVNLRGASLANADFRGATFCWTVLAEVDLLAAKNLGTTYHAGPSYLSRDTLLCLGGRITEEIRVFLTGCGLQPWEIEQARMYDPALTPAEIAELQIKIFDKRTAGPLFLGGAFISYSRADSDFVDRVYKQLKSEGMPVWLDRHDLVAGELQEQIARAIRLQDVVLLVLSKSSTVSDWVENELDMARHKEKSEGRRVLCPIALDDSWKSRLDNSASDRALWRTLAKKVILDFSDPDQFETQYQKLVRGLKVNFEKKPGEQE